MILDVPYSVDVPLRRPAVKFGDKTWPDNPTATVSLARSLDAPVRVGDGDATTQTGRIYVERGTDVQDGDKVTLPEGDFLVTGGPQLDKEHEMTGDDFGWVRYSIERG